MWDYDTGLRGGDDKLAEAHTFQLPGASGQLTSAVRMRFSTSEGGERGPDLYVRIVKPAGAAFEEFVRNSYFATGSPYWPSKVQSNEEGGFYREDFDGDTVGVEQPVRLVMSLVGKIRIRAALESYAIVSNEFEKLPAGIPVKIMDSKPAASQPLLNTATTDENGAIGAVIQQREDYRPSIYFQIDRDAGESTVNLVDYFGDHTSWNSRDKQAEIVAADGAVRTRSGHFENWTDTTLVAANERLRFRLEAPRIQMHLRFEYFDREAGGYRPLPVGTEVEVWKDDAAAVHAQVIGVIGQDGRAELSVPKEGDERPTLYARVVMRRRLSTEDPVLAPTATVLEAGAVLRWETRGQTAADGADCGPVCQRREPGGHSRQPRDLPYRRRSRRRHDSSTPRRLCCG